MKPTVFAEALVGLSELLLAYISYSYSKYPMLRCLKYFAYGLVVLAVKEVLCGTLCLGIVTYSLIGTALEALGLSLIVYSVAKILKLNVKYIILMFVLLALFSMLSILELPNGELIASISFTFFMPFLLSLIFMKDFIATKDTNLLLTSLGFLLYSLSLVVEVLLTVFGTVTFAINISLIIKLAAVVTLIVAFLR